VVRERYLPEYMQLIDSELKKTARLLRRRHQVVRSAIDSIAEQAKKAESVEQRSILDYTG
jgi:peptide subunit release factor 1 (eRF1)